MSSNDYKAFESIGYVSRHSITDHGESPWRQPGAWTVQCVAAVVLSSAERGNCRVASHSAVQDCVETWHPAAWCWRAGLCSAVATAGQAAARPRPIVPGAGQHEEERGVALRVHGRCQKMRQHRPGENKWAVDRRFEYWGTAGTKWLSSWWACGTFQTSGGNLIFWKSRPRSLVCPADSLEPPQWGSQSSWESRGVSTCA